MKELLKKNFSVNLIYPCNLQKDGIRIKKKKKIKRTSKKKKKETYLNHTSFTLHEMIYLISAGLNSWGDMVVKICGSKD